MKIHNLLEDVVIEKVEEIFDDEEANATAGFCTCEQCRLDVACYVLNRAYPEYVISGRGYAHILSEYKDDTQKITDITALVMDGIKKVSRSKRPFFPHTEGKGAEPAQGPYYNFPIIAGRMFDGKTFEPVSNIDVYLESDGGRVPMKNPNWQNPYHISESTAGNFMFWPGPVPAESPGLTKNVTFKIIAGSDTYEEMSHVFSLDIISLDERLDTFCLNENFLLGDLYLFTQAASSDIAGAED